MRLIQVWFKCDHPGCEAVAEALVPCRWYTSVFSVDPETVPDGWRNKSEVRRTFTRAEGEGVFKPSPARHPTYCPAHA